ncbi:hypothetical protein LIER_05057 [Lithospermum erythrorhizon]|uniref:Reverse transcriptase domain-containing protein n=1 Tax=Lithospermum erythrorhizon TaxID=34254 RepID=A0AAV3P0Z6_LITER
MVEWKVKGDRNTILFHAISAQRGKSNFITAFQREDDLVTYHFCREQLVELEKELSLAKVKSCLVSMKGCKAPSPDGIKFNFTLIVLVPKVGKPINMTQFRPIALCNTVIFESQSAFVPNQLITANVLLEYEMHHFIKHKKTGIVGYISIKLDMLKAYDKIEWKRAEQEDPLSPYFFIIYTEGLILLLKEAWRKGELQGITLGLNMEALTRLMFTDDMLLFGRAALEAARIFKLIL